jgi:hypothetical protein
MSVDLEVWSSKSFELPKVLPQSDRWNEMAGEWAFEAAGWQVLVITDEDEPSESVAEALPGATHVAHVTLEPIGATKDAFTFLESVVRSLAKSNNGRWVDADGHVHRHAEGHF